MTAVYAATQDRITPHHSSTNVPIQLTDDEKERLDAGGLFRLAVYDTGEAFNENVVNVLNSYPSSDWTHVTGNYYEARRVEIGVAENIRVQEFDNVELLVSHIDAEQWRQALDVEHRPEPINSLPTPLVTGQRYVLLNSDTILGDLQATILSPQPNLKDIAISVGNVNAIRSSSVAAGGNQAYLNAVWVSLHTPPNLSLIHI